MKLLENIYIFGVITENPCNKPMECNEIYIPITRLSEYIYNLFKILIETDVNTSDELNFSYLYRSVDYIESLAKFTRTPSDSLCQRPNVVYTSINLRKMKFIP